jgi:CBS domain-containing protein
MATNKLGFLISQPPQNQIQDSSLSVPVAGYRDWLKVGDVMSEDIATIDPKSNVVSAARILSGRTISCLIVLNDGRLSGIVTETDMLKKAVADGHGFRKIKVEQIMSSPIRSIPRSSSVMDASKIMEVENIRRLVVLEEGKPVGIITQTGMVRVLASYTVSKEVSEILTRDVVVIVSSASAREAAELMTSQDISCLVVMDDDDVVGIFTERDFLKRVIGLNQNPARITLKQVMSEPVVTIPASYSLLSATKLMERIGIRHLVVMEYDTLLGIITQTDILKALKTTLQGEEKKYFRLLSESNSCIFTVDLDLNTTYMNYAFMRLLDVTDPNELIDKPFLPKRFWEVPGQRDRLLDQLRKVSVTVDELSLETTKGRRLSVILFCMPNKNLTGEVNGSQGILYDITVNRDRKGSCPFFSP